MLWDILLIRQRYDFEDYGYVNSFYGYVNYFLFLWFLHLILGM